MAFRTRSGKGASRWISNRSLAFSQIRLDGRVWDEDLGTLLLETIRLRPVTPVLVSVPGMGPEFRKRLEALGVGVALDAAAAEGGGHSGEQHLQPGFAAPQSLAEEGEYLGIPVLDFLGVERVSFDLFFKSPLGKFVLLSRAGESGLADRVSGYWQKGLQYLYVRRQDQDLRTSQLERLIAGLSTDPAAPGMLRATRAVRSISRRLESLQRMEEVDLGLWNFVAGELAGLFETWSQGPWRDAETALWNATLLDHSTAVLVIALMLGRHLDFATPATATRLGLAAVFHDVGLLGMPLAPGRVFHEDRPQEWSPEMRQWHEDHAARGADWVLHQLHADGLVGQAIALHHWRRDRREAFGGASGVPRLVEVIGLAEELNSEILSEGFTFSSGWLERFHSRVSDRFSAVVLDALPKTFSRSAPSAEIEIDFDSFGEGR